MKILEVVNLGEDTDATAAITGGPCWSFYGSASIPKRWINALARKEDIEDLARRLGKASLQSICVHRFFE